jgi:predicted amidohydrolase YtcJ
VSHLYVILRGGTVVPGPGEPDATAIAWARDTILIVGSDEDATGISRGDSDFHELEGSVVVPLDASGRPDPVGGVLEIGGQADLAVLDADPRVVGSASVVALVRGGRVVEGALPSGNRFERMVGR